MDTTDLAIDGMTCAACVSRVERVLACVPGVTNVAVNLATERARIRGDRDTLLRLAASLQAGPRSAWSPTLYC